jgi:tetratricopeptide (TPR) repeat protein
LKWLETQDPEYQTSASAEETYKLIGDAYFFRKPRELTTALSWYNKSLEINPNQKRVLETLAIAYHTNKSYAQALDFYQRRIALGIDSADASILKNAGFCALNLANAGEGEEELDLEMEGEEISNGDLMASIETTMVTPNIDYYKVAIDYLTQFSKFNATDAKVVTLIANTYLYQMKDCGNGVKWFEKVLVLEPGNCDAKKALGFAYFGGTCTKNYAKALGYLKDAYSCIAKTSGACSDKEVAMWIAQCYHLQGADKIAAKASASEEFKNAYEWYGKVLECDPNNAIAKKGRDDLQFEF